MDESNGLPWPARQLVRLVTRRVATILLGSAARPAADEVVGTFLAAGHMVSLARKAGVSTPSVPYVTDPAAHHLWVADDIDPYLTT